MTRDVEQHISKCSVCNAYRNSQPPEPLMPHPVPERPWQKVGVDIFHLFGRDHLLIVDYFSKFPEVCSLDDKSAMAVINKLKAVFSRQGIPEEVFADNNPFGSREMRQFADEWNFNIVTMSPMFSQSNGQIEHCVQTVKSLLKKAHDSGSAPHIALLMYRNAPIAGTTHSPAQMLMSRELRTKLPVINQQLQPKVVTSEAREQLCNNKAKQKEYYDRRARPLHPLNAGDVIRVRHRDQWMPGQVVEPHQFAPRSYIVKTEEGSVLPRNRRHLLKTDEELSPQVVEDDVGGNVRETVSSAPPVES